MTLHRTAALFAGILFALAALPAHAGAGGCDDWAAKRSMMAGFGKFFEVEGEYRENLVGNFNLAPPRTDLDPDMVGYSWSGGGEFARLYMVGDGCVLAERLYPMKLVWRMMGSYPAVPIDMDKSGERYALQLQEQQALRQKLEKLALESARQAAEAEGEYDPDSAAGDDQFMEEMD
ncbi:MAG: hypothetical protein KAR37_02455 [Alphaproteobacteria bacterium]|nr:hypothetical protein [Alphaproteobacteria bacterium]